MPSERILFVDDDPVSRSSFARAMRRNGFIVDLAKDGDEAWELASHFPYAVIATDLRMPGMDGMMLIDQLRELQPDPVCLLVTASDQLDWYGLSGDDTSGVDVIRKPWNADQLAESLKLAIKEYRRRMPLGSDRPSPEESHRVALVGLSHDARAQVAKLLESSYELVDAKDVAEAEHTLKREGASIACCVAGDLVCERAAIARLADACRRVPLIVVGPDRGAEVAVEAIRQGAHDWLPLGRLREAGLERAVAVAVERCRGITHDLPLCSDVTTPGMFRDRLRQAKSRARRFSRQTALLMVGLGGYDGLSSALGQVAVHKVLGQIGERLRGSVRESDSVIHLGRDVFALLLEDLGPGSMLDVPAQRVLNSFATPFRCDDHEIVVTASVGAVVYPTNGEDLDELVRKGEQALVHARTEGRNRYWVCSELAAAPAPPAAVVEATG
jgi:diguanylate cyclase (GGDEF)-like protein